MNILNEEKKHKTINTKIAFAINIAIVLAEVVAAIIGAIEKWDEYKFRVFEFYTQDSNLFLFVACIAMAIEQWKVLFGKNNNNVSVHIQRLKYMATCTVTLTFLVVLFVLIPYAGIESVVDKLFCGSSLYHHFLCPIMAFVSFVFFEREPNLRYIDTLWAEIPTLVYAVVIVLLNVFRVVEGPYPFLKVYQQEWYMSIIWVFVILGGAYGIAVGVFFANSARKNKKNIDKRGKEDEIQRSENE